MPGAGKKHWESYFSALKDQNWESALDSLNAILKQEPKNAQVHLKVGDIFQKAGDTVGAVAAYQQAAWLLMKQGFLQKSLAAFKIILRIDPDNTEAINRSKELMMELESSKLNAQAKPLSEPEITGPAGGAEAALSAEKPAAAGTMKPVREEPEALVPLFLSPVPEGERKQIISKLTPRLFMPGEAVVREGDSGDSIFFIRSGDARVVAHVLGKEIELAKLSAGDAFGEVAFLTGRPRTASVIAINKLDVLEFNKRLLEKIFEKYPEIFKRLEDFYQSHVQDTLKKVKNSIKK